MTEALGRSQRRVLDADAPMVVLLPVGCTWTYSDTHVPLRYLERWNKRNVIEMTAQLTGNRDALYEIPRHRYEYACHRCMDDGRLPCYCSGFTSVDGGIECRHHGYFYPTADAKRHLGP